MRMYVNPYFKSPKILFFFRLNANGIFGLEHLLKLTVKCTTIFTLGKKSLVNTKESYHYNSQSPHFCSGVLLYNRLKRFYD